MAKKIISIFLLSIFINSCGFRVIYHEKEGEFSYEKELASIKIQKSAGRQSQEMRNALYDLFNPDDIKAEPKYYLVLTISESIGSTFLTSTGASGRNKITLTVNYEFRSLETGKLIAFGSTVANDNYDVQTNRYGTYTAEEYVKLNLTKILAQNLRNLLVNDIIELSRKKEKKAETIKEKSKASSKKN